MRFAALMGCWLFGIGFAQANEVSERSVTLPAWAQVQYAEAQATTDPVARRLLLEHLLDALSPEDLLWLRVKGQLTVLAYWEGR